MKYLASMALLSTLLLAFSSCEQVNEEKKNDSTQSEQANPNGDAPSNGSIEAEGK